MKIEVSFRHTENGRTVDTSICCDLPGANDPSCLPDMNPEDTAALFAEKLFERCMDAVREASSL